MDSLTQKVAKVLNDLWVGDEEAQIAATEKLAALGDVRH